MRKNTARHWLHATLDLLPVLLIPVFMIYSHRHDMTQQTTVDIQYKYQSNEVNSLDDLVEGNVYKYNVYNIGVLNTLLPNEYILLQPLEEIKFNSNAWINDTYDSEIYNKNLILEFGNYNGDFTISLYSSLYQYYNLDCYIEYAFDGIFLNDFNFVLFETNLTKYQYISYTDYNEIESVDVHDETSSVMNVFVDNFNNAINKYFNMGNVFGMTNVYQWFNTNIFGGNAPTIIFSVWNIVLYEFVMDLIFLLYALFMWFIDVTKRLIEKPLDSIK